MAAKKSNKTPKSLFNPTESKTPKIGVVPNENCLPDFKSEQMDMDGPWGWKHFDSKQLQELLQKVFECQKLTWQDLRNNKSHLVNRENLCSGAQKRLTEIQKEDLDQLFSLRLTGRKRVWGIKEGNILWLLWWDPNHEVCPSTKN